MFTDESPSSKRRKEEKLAINRKLQMILENSSSQSSAHRSLNLSSTTLILFDEVCYTVCCVIDLTCFLVQHGHVNSVLYFCTKSKC